MPKKYDNALFLFVVARRLGLLSSDEVSALRRCEHALERDLAAHGERTWKIIIRLRNPQLHFQRTLRFYEFSLSLNRRRWLLFRLVARLQYHGATMKTGISIPPNVCAPGLSIAHIGTIVINSKALIGEFCRINASVNIGESAGHAPAIGDNVFIGPGAVLYGKVEVGSGAVIGANAVINANVPPGHLAAGVPARDLGTVAVGDHMPSWFDEFIPSKPGASGQASSLGLEQGNE